MKHFPLLSLLLLTVAGLGCAASSGEVTARPDFAPIARNQARVFLYRIDEPENGLPASVLLDQQLLGEVPAGTYGYVDLDVGKHTLSTSDHLDQPLAFSVEDQELVYVRLRTSVGDAAGGAIPEIAMEESALRAFAGLKFTGGR